jgi:hypothetical protein
MSPFPSTKRTKVDRGPTKTAKVQCRYVLMVAGATMPALIPVVASAAEMAPPSPAVSFGVACVALVASLVTSGVALWNARRSRAAEAETAVRRAALDRELTVFQEAAETARGAARQSADLALAEFNLSAQQDLERLKATLEEQAQNRRIMSVLNEENWRHVLLGLRKLKDTGFAMTASFKLLANQSHTNVSITEELLIEQSLKALQAHEEFRKALSPLRGEVREKDYDELQYLLKYLVIVFLDVGRTVSERTAKKADMAAHETKIIEHEEKFEALISWALQPYRNQGSRAKTENSVPKT